MQHDPCCGCPCESHKLTCQDFCSAYKQAVADDVRKGLAEIGIAVHERIIRRE